MENQIKKERERWGERQRECMCERERGGGETDIYKYLVFTLTS